MSSAVDNADPKPRTGKKASYLDLVDDPDQERVRADLSEFFGPRAEIYLAMYDKVREAPAAKRTVIRSWSWPVFFGAFTWFFYRKMYAYGALLVIAPVILGYLFGGTQCRDRNSVRDVGEVLVRQLRPEPISKADKLGLTGTERAEYLQKAGGVSLTAGIFAGLIYAVCHRSGDLRSRQSTHSRPLMVRFVILLAAITPPLIILELRNRAKRAATWRSEATWNAFLVGAVSAIAAIGCELALDFLLALDRMSPLVGSAGQGCPARRDPRRIDQVFCPGKSRREACRCPPSAGYHRTRACRLAWFCHF